MNHCPLFAITSSSLSFSAYCLSVNKTAPSVSKKMILGEDLTPPNITNLNIELSRFVVLGGDRFGFLDGGSIV